MTAGHRKLTIAWAGARAKKTRGGKGHRRRRRRRNAINRAKFVAKRMARSSGYVEWLRRVVTRCAGSARFHTWRGAGHWRAGRGGSPPPSTPDGAVSAIVRGGPGVPRATI